MASISLLSQCLNSPFCVAGPRLPDPRRVTPCCSLRDDHRTDSSQSVRRMLSTESIKRIIRAKFHKVTDPPGQGFDHWLQALWLVERSDPPQIQRVSSFVESDPADLQWMMLVCIRFHVIFVSCDCIMKCIFVWTQVVNKLLLLLG